MGGGCCSDSRINFGEVRTGFIPWKVIFNDQIEKQSIGYRV